MSRVYVFLADGFEEIEALATVDVLRRADISVTTVGITGKMVTGGHNIKVEADINGEDFNLPNEAEMLVLPGGAQGSKNLGSSTVVKNALLEASARNIYIAAICAAPLVLNKYGLLENKIVTAYPSVQDELTDSIVKGGAVEVDGNIITGRSAGVAIDFARQIVAALSDEEEAENIISELYPDSPGDKDK